MKILFVVESPAKAKSIAGYLKEVDGNNNYYVKASMGHIRDLEEKSLSINVDDQFKIKYRNLPNKTKVINDLTGISKEVDMVLLATDNDREGESIAWHIVKCLSLQERKIPYQRVLFNEITKSAMKEAISNPKQIDEGLVDAQQARRCIDRLVGFSVSPVLWKIFNRKTLSAGRVQSAVMTLLMNKETDIDQFQAEKYWEIEGEFKGLPKGVLHEEKEAARFERAVDLTKVLDLLKRVDRYQVEKSIKERQEYAPPPFITSSLQQDAYRSLGIGSKACMKLAQDLYEGGHITYMRTDSFHLSAQAVGMIKAHVIAKYGDNYYQFRAHGAKKVKGGQKAHEAIRPTNLGTTDAHIKSKLSMQHSKLYHMIYQRAVASLMANAVYDDHIYQLSFGHETYRFVCKESFLKFEGFHAAYGREPDAKKERTSIKETVALIIKAVNKLSSAPTRYNEGTLVKALEKEGIGRPSTYSSIIDKILAKEYAVVESSESTTIPGVDYILQSGTIKQQVTEIAVPGEKSRIKVTDNGKAVYQYLAKQFQMITNLKFTAEMENSLDEIAHNDKSYLGVVEQFWKEIKPSLDTALSSSQKIKLQSKKVAQAREFGDAVVREARFGPVIERNKEFTDLKPLFRSTGLTIETMTEEDVKFLLSLPIKCSKIEFELAYARYGFYYINLNDKKNVSVTDAFVKRIHKDHGLAALATQDEKSIMQNKKIARRFAKKKF